jgi:chromate transporter
MHTFPLERPLRGIAPVVIALIAVAGARLARASVRRVTDVPLALLGVFAVAFRPRWELAAMAVGAVVGLARERTEAPRVSPTVILPAWKALPMFASIAGAVSLSPLAWLFFRSGALLFGGGYFLLPLLEPNVIAPVGWLTRREFLDGLAIVHALPGPVTSVCAFYGYRAHGVAGAIVAIVAVYLPSFAAVYLVAPWLRRHQEGARVKAALDGVNPVVAGTILGAAAVYAPEALRDWIGLGISIVAVVLLARTKVNPAWLVLAGAIVGVAITSTSG